MTRRLAAVFVVVIGVGAFWLVVDGIHRARRPMDTPQTPAARDRDVKLDNVITPPDPTVAAALDACRLRTEDLRLALDTLIRTAPRAWNLEHLPVVGAEGWPAWPRVGQAHEHVRVQDWDGRDVTPAKGAGR